MVTTNESPVLYPIELGHMVVTVRGITPLICHRFSEVNRDVIVRGQDGSAKRGKAPRDPEGEFRGALYIRPEDGKYGFPAIAFKKAMVRAAKNAGIAMTDARTTFHVIGDLLEIRGSEPVMRSDRVVLQRKTTSVAYRPMFEEWEIDVPVRFNARAITAEQIVNLLQLAGFGVGIGDWRPERDGQFGMFEVKADE